MFTSSPSGTCPKKFRGCTVTVNPTRVFYFDSLIQKLSKLLYLLLFCWAFPTSETATLTKPQCLSFVLIFLPRTPCHCYGLTENKYTKSKTTLIPANFSGDSWHFKQWSNCPSLTAPIRLMPGSAPLQYWPAWLSLNEQNRQSSKYLHCTKTFRLSSLCPKAVLFRDSLCRVQLCFCLNVFVHFKEVKKTFLPI